MLKKKAITVLTMSVVLATAIGFSTPHKNVHAESADVVYLEQNLADTENATLVLNQKSGSNDVTLVLEFSDDYTKSVTSFEALIQLDYNKIKNVTVDWNKEFTTNHCRYTYDEKTGELKLYVVDKNDLLKERKITIGNMSLVSDETTNFNSTVVLEELKIVDLQHNSDVVTVDRTAHNIEFTTSDKPSTDKPSTDKPSTDKPSTDKPSTDKPSTDKPSTDKPSTDKPSTDNPTTDNPTTDGSTTDKPSTNRPSTDSSTTDNPSTNGQSTGSSTTDNPSTNGQSTGSSSTDNSSTDESSTDVLDSESNEEDTSLTEEDSLSTQEPESGESQNDTGESDNSEITTESPKGEKSKNIIGTAMIMIASIIGVTLLCFCATVLIVKLRKGKN